MRSARLVAAALLAATATAVLSPSPPASSAPSPVQQPTSADPDRPFSGGMTHAQYAEARAAYFARRRAGRLAGGTDLRAAAVTDRAVALHRAARATATTPVWTPLGPNPLPNGQTSDVPMPVSGRVSAIAVDPSDSSNVYVGTPGGGVFRTQDAGATWAPVFQSMTSLVIGALAFAPSNPDVLYVGTGDQHSDPGVGLFRVDGASGSAPTLVGPINPEEPTAYGAERPFTGNAVTRILVSPTDPADVLVTTTYTRSWKDQIVPADYSAPGLWRSTNATSAASSVALSKLRLANGDDWFSITDAAFVPAAPGALLVATNEQPTSGGGVYRTADAWASTPSFVRTYAPRELESFRLSAVGDGAGGAAYLMSTAGDRRGALLASTDGGATWSERPAGAGACGDQCDYDMPVAADPADPKHLLLGGSTDGEYYGEASDILRSSSDGGLTYQRRNSLLHPDSHEIVFDPAAPGRVWLGGDGGVFRSDNGGQTWSSKNSGGLDAMQWQSLSTHPAAPDVTLGGTQDNGTQLRLADGTWTLAAYGDGGPNAIDRSATSVSSGAIYHEYFSAPGSFIGIDRALSVDAASRKDWTTYGCGERAVANGISCDDDSLFYSPMELGPGSPNTLYLGTDRLYRSSDRGATMTPVSQHPIVEGSRVSAIGISPASDQVRLVGLDTGEVLGTTTGSSTLVDYTGSLPRTTALGQPLYVTDIAMDPTDTSTAYVSLGGYLGGGRAHVWKTTDLASGHPTWTSMSSGLPDVPTNTLAINPARRAQVLVGTEIGVYASADGGASWAPYGSGLPAMPVYDLAIVRPLEAAASVRIATFGRGAWEAPLRVQTPESVSIDGGLSSVALGRGVRYRATAHYADGSSLDVTGAAAWSSSATSVATVPTKGSVSTKGQGRTTVSVTYLSRTASRSLTVTPPEAESLDVAPASSSVAAGRSKQLTATAVLSDGTRSTVTSEATWRSSSTSTATVSSGGLVKTLAKGSVVITATAGGLTDSATLTVTAAALKSLSLSPSPTSVRVGSTRALSVTGTYTDGSTKAITSGLTWSSSTGCARVSSSGVVTGVRYGTATIKAAVGGITGTDSVTVRSKPPTISGFSPAKAKPGATVTITGTSFTSAAGVSFNGVTAASVTYVDSRTLRAVVPRGSTAGHIHVRTDGGTATSGSSFTPLR